MNEDTICQECGHPFTRDEWEDRHSSEYGDDVHADCCGACKFKEKLKSINFGTRIEARK